MDDAKVSLAELWEEVKELRYLVDRLCEGRENVGRP